MRPDSRLRRPPILLDRIPELERPFVVRVRVGPTEEAVSPSLLNNYTGTLRQLNRLDEARDYSERAYAKAPHIGDQDAIYHALNTRALVYIDQRDFKRAESMLTELEPIVLRILPPGHYWLGSLASVQGLLASGKGDSKRHSSWPIARWISWKLRARPGERAAASFPSRISVELLWSWNPVIQIRP